MAVCLPHAQFLFSLAILGGFDVECGSEIEKQNGTLEGKTRDEHPEDPGLKLICLQFVEACVGLVAIVKNARELEDQHQPKNHVFEVGQVYQVLTHEDQVAHLCRVVEKAVVICVFAETVWIARAEGPLAGVRQRLVRTILGEHGDELEGQVVGHPLVDDRKRAVDRDELHPIHKFAPIILVLHTLVTEKFYLHCIHF